MNQHFELSSDIESIAKVELLIDELSEKIDIGEDNYGNILIALTEAMNNAITHGNQLDPEKKVSLDLTTTDEELLFSIRDEGDGFDYDNIPDPTLPENLEKLTGRGVFLMKSLADDVEFKENGSLIQLKFCLSVS